MMLAEGPHPCTWPLSRPDSGLRRLLLRSVQLKAVSRKTSSCSSPRQGSLDGSRKTALQPGRPHHRAEPSDVVWGLQRAHLENRERGHSPALRHVPQLLGPKFQAHLYRHLGRGLTTGCPPQPLSPAVAVCGNKGGGACRSRPRAVHTSAREALPTLRGGAAWPCSTEEETGRGDWVFSPTERS